MARLAVFVTLCVVVEHAIVSASDATGPWCITCHKSKGEDESNCNDQQNRNVKHCRANEVCTTDVRCDRKDRVRWSKGCEKRRGITSYNEILCRDGRRCHLHCDTGDYCNEHVPNLLTQMLVCTDPPPTPPADPTEPTTMPEVTTVPEPDGTTAAEPITTTPPAGGPSCVVCATTEGRDAECIAAGSTVQCGVDQACYSKFKCRKQGDLDRGIIQKKCVDPSKCKSLTEPWVKVNGNGNVVARECCFTDGCNDLVVASLEPVVTANGGFCLP